MSVLQRSDSTLIREVYAENLEEEFSVIRGIVEQYPFISMDTEFPGIIYKEWRSTEEGKYSNFRRNVDVLKLVQLGLTFFDEKGNLPSIDGQHLCWQFNFREFNPNHDLSAPDSLRLLHESGINFAKNMENGVDVTRFDTLFTMSGLVQNARMRWITFHGAYDFAFLMKMLIGSYLPDSLDRYQSLLNTYFPVIYDLKFMISLTPYDGGLRGLGLALNVERLGTAHQAGSDSLLTAGVFVKQGSDRHVCWEGLWWIVAGYQSSYILRFEI
ncbi:hypothetical protein SASPL_118249 [Salvia splendens]|uniref:poly(A)-specific ribonuclease n=1 Tax=Salvia splendens TaxID=180675 RepID=A0A8X8ZYY7_SALSN|nr:hypothetical protein SASPL_118248 [Salvia splendens]KAG6421692.1 hypothetical protein SASPL_118249 [Salvia splendens]